MQCRKVNEALKYFFRSGAFFAWLVTADELQINRRGRSATRVAGRGIWYFSRPGPWNLFEPCVFAVSLAYCHLMG
jgi:hypothetical protein